TIDDANGSKLCARWSFLRALLPDEAVRDLAERWFDALRAVVLHVSQPAAGGHTPSDLPLTPLTQSEIERLESQHPRLEDVLPLSPLQEGLLFHATFDAQAPDLYTVQLDLELQGPLDAVLLAQSAQSLLKRHASLRGCFKHDQSGPD